VAHVNVRLTIRQGLETKFPNIDPESPAIDLALFRILKEQYPTEFDRDDQQILEELERNLENGKFEQLPAEAGAA